MSALRKRIGIGLLASAWLASLGNYLWLLGLVAQPADNLMFARWAYSGGAAFLAVMVLAFDL